LSAFAKTDHATQKSLNTTGQCQASVSQRISGHACAKAVSVSLSREEWYSLFGGLLVEVLAQHSIPTRASLSSTPKIRLVTRYNFRKLCRSQVAALMTRDSKPINSREVFLYAERRTLSVSREGPRDPSSERSSCRLPRPIRRCATGQANIRARWRRCR
jgi:hypothetical protein